MDAQPTQSTPEVEYDARHHADAVPAGALPDVDDLRALRRFITTWWDDPLNVGAACAAWDRLPESARMWALDDDDATNTPAAAAPSEVTASDSRDVHP